MHPSLNKKVLFCALCRFYFASVSNVQNRSLYAHQISLAHFPAWWSLAGSVTTTVKSQASATRMAALSHWQDCLLLWPLWVSVVLMLFQGLLRFGFGALLRGICTSTESPSQKQSTEHKQWRTCETFLLVFCVFNWIPCKSHVLDLFSVSLLPCSSPPASMTSLWLVLNLLGYLD